MLMSTTAAGECWPQTQTLEEEQVGGSSTAAASTPPPNAGNGGGARWCHQLAEEQHPRNQEMILDFVDAATVRYMIEISNDKLITNWKNWAYTA